MKKYQQIFFDLDGTLWDIHTNSRIALSEIFFELFPHSSAKNFDRFYSHYQKWNERLWSAYRKNKITKEHLRTTRFEKALSITNLPYDATLVEYFANAFLKRCPALPHLMPGAIELLEHCSGRYPLHIITNGFKEVQQIKMESSDILKYFEHFFYSEDLGVKKPHPEIFRNALKVSDCTAETALMVGDDWGADVLGAKNAGIDQVYYNPNRHKDRRHNYTPTYQFDHLMHLREIL